MTPAQKSMKAHETAARRSALESEMLQQLRAAGLTDGMEREYQIVEGRKFRADFAWPAKMWCLEIDGGTWTGGRHVRPEGFGRDCVKANMAALAGWRMIRATGDHVKNGQALAWIEAALK